MSTQLTIDGREEPWPPPAPHHLTERQRELLRYLADVYGVEPFRTGAAGRHFADPSGALRRLERLGLVCSLGRGRWQRIPEGAPIPFVPIYVNGRLIGSGTVGLANALAAMVEAPK